MFLMCLEVFRGGCFVLFSYVSIVLKCCDLVWAIYSIKKEVGCTPVPTPSVRREDGHASFSIVPGARVSNGDLMQSVCVFFVRFPLCWVMI